MIGFSLLCGGLGVLLCARPEVWIEWNAPEREKGRRPEAKALSRTRRNGVMLVLGAAALLVVQSLKG